VRVDTIGAPPAGRNWSTGAYGAFPAPRCFPGTGRGGYDSRALSDRARRDVLIGTVTEGDVEEVGRPA